MNIGNISALAEQLLALGFEDAGNSLAKRVCFKPRNFVVTKKIEKGNDQVSFNLFFEKKDKVDVYVLKYYDAILQKEILFGDTVINGVDIAGLQKQMADIDWKKAFDFSEKKPWAPNDKASQENGEKIEMIILSLAEIETTDEGKSVAAALKSEYWTGSAYFELFDSLNQTRSKAEVSQRFYCSEGQPCISVDEAFRFLQNRKLEKQMQAKRKQPGSQNDEEHAEDTSGTSGSGLLKKRRLNGGARTKRNNAANQ